MQIQLNTDHNIEGRESLAAHVTTIVEAALSRFSDRVTRVEVHLSDENGDKSGQHDKRCMMEVRLAGRQPTAVTHHAASVHEAIDGAVGKLERAVETISERARDDRHGNA